MANRKRNQPLFFRVNEEEREIIAKKMSIIGTDNLGLYLRRMAIYGYMIEVDLQPLGKATTQLNRISSNLNQIAKRANETSSIYLEDIEKLGEDITEIKGYMRELMDGLIETIDK